MTMTELVTQADEVPLERIEAQIISLAGTVAAGEAELLRWLAEYDRREGWASWECKSAAHWLSWKCGDSLHAARERVRVARALEVLPVIGEAFAGGELSYSKVRAITRVAEPSDEHVWLSVARHETGAGLDRMVADVRHAVKPSDEAELAWRERRVVERDGRRAGQRQAVADLPSDAAKTVMAALDVRASQIIDDATNGSGRRRREIIEERGGIAAVRADALVQLAEEAIAAAGPKVERGDVGRMSMVVEPELLADDNAEGECSLDGHTVATEAARRWACDVRADVLVEQRDGKPFARHGRDVGRATPVVSRRLRRAVLRRDRGMCQHPGCGATTHLHMHHIHPWVEGGPTKLANLISLCSFHHHSVHEGGWLVRFDDSGEPVWSAPDHRATEAPVLSGSSADLPPGELADRWSGRLADRAFAVSVIAEQVGGGGPQNVPAGTSSLTSDHDRHAVARRRRWPRGGLSDG